MPVWGGVSALILRSVSVGWQEGVSGWQTRGYGTVIAGHEHAAARWMPGHRHRPRVRAAVAKAGIFVADLCKYSNAGEKLSPISGGTRAKMRVQLD